MSRIPLTRRLRRPPNFAALALCALTALLMYIEASVATVTVFVDPVPPALIVQGVFSPAGPLVPSTPYWFYGVHLFLVGVAVCFCRSTHYRVRQVCVLLAVVTWPIAFLIESHDASVVPWILIHGPRDLLGAFLGESTGEFWDEGHAVICFTAIWVYAWVLIILPLELIDRRRRGNATIAEAAPDEPPPRPTVDRH